jgi:hypothetical protein
MTTLRSIVDGLATELMDFVPGNAQMSYQQWSQLTLLGYVNEAMAVIATHKPADFAQTVLLKLQPGTTQQPCCKVIGTVTEQVDANGNHVSNVRTSTTATALRWNKPSCASNPLDYRVGMVYGLNKTATSFDVSPPVPAVGDFYVKLKCVQAPCEWALADLDSAVPDSRYLAAIRQWALFRALGNSRDSVAETREAWQHEKAFYTLLGIQYRMEQNLKAEAVSG